MSEIIKTEAVVIRKADHGDSSKILSLYTKDHGRISVIAKGIKSPKSKLNSRLEIFNNVEVVIYSKSSRNIQLISGADIIKVYNSLTEDLDRYQYAAAILELFNTLIHEHEKNEKLYKGLIRILSLLNDSKNDSQFLFVKFFFFLVNEIGYAIELKKCNNCHKELVNEGGVFYNHTEGILCSDCSEGHMINFEFSKELFNLVICLSYKNTECNYTKQDLDLLIMFLEKHVAYHVDGFRSLKSLKIF